MLNDVFVHLDGGADDDIRLAHAEKLVSAFGSNLIGIFTNPLVEYAYVLAVQSGLAPMEPIIEAQENTRQEGDRAVVRLQKKLAGFSKPGVIRRLDVGTSQIVSRVVDLSHWADVFVAMAPYGPEAIPLWNNLVEGVMFESGRPIYLVPHTHPVPSNLENVLIAWSPTREASRAIAGALPLLKSSKNIRLVTIDSDSSFELEDIFDAAMISSYFDHHGLRVGVDSFKLKGRVVSEILAEEARKMHADLIVMGAYGHSRLREWVLGGTTRNMIGSADIPLLLAH